MSIAQAQRTHSAEIIDCAKIVELGQCAQLWVFLSALGMCASDDTTTPRIWLGVSEGKEEKRVFLGCGLAGLVARRGPEVRRYVKRVSVVEPILEVGELREYSRPVSYCWRRFKIEPPCRLNFEPGLMANL